MSGQMPLVTQVEPGENSLYALSQVLSDILSQCKSIDTKIMKTISKGNIEVSYRSDERTSKIMTICKFGYACAVTMLVNWLSEMVKELNVNRIILGETALTLAAHRKSIDVFNLLSSALFSQAVGDIKVKTVKRFLNSYRAEYAKCFQSLCSHYIVRKNHLNFIAFYTERPHGSCISYSDWSEALYNAHRHNCLGIVDQLFEFEKIACSEPRKGWTAIHLALFQCRRQLNQKEITLLEILLNSDKLDVNALTNNEETVLHFACRCTGSKELEKIIQKILNHKVDVNQKNLFGETALMIACKNGNVVAVREILTWKDTSGVKLDITAKDNQGNTVLSISKQSNKTEIVTIIEQTLFLTAAENDDIESAEHYLHLSNNERAFEKRDNINSLPELNVLSGQSETLVKTISEPSPSEELNKLQPPSKSLTDSSISFSVWLKAVWLAERRSHGNVLNLLLNGNRFTNGFNEDGQTILHVAVEKLFASKGETRELETIKILLESGRCEVNALNFLKETILHISANGNPSAQERIMYEFLNILIEHGFDFNRRNNLGKTALMIAYENGFNNLAQMLLKLKRKGRIQLDIGAVDDLGETSLMIGRIEDKSFENYNLLAAIENKNEDFVKCLLDKARRSNGENSEMRLSRQWSCSKIWATDEPTGRSYTNRLKLYTWKMAVEAAFQKSNNDILKLLLGFDSLVEKQNYSNGDRIIHMLLDSRKSFLLYEVGHDRLQLNSVECVLKSNKISVNSLNFKAETALHLVFKCCKYPVDYFCHGNHRNVTREILLLLFRHGININQRDKEGKTPLSIASEIGCTFIMRTILDWAKETDTWLDIDARDHAGQTALMKAAKWKHADNVKMLLNAGASVNLSDNRGFTALHHALYEVMNPTLWIDFGGIPKNVEEVKRRKEIKVTLFETLEPHFRYNRNRSKMEEDKLKTTELLLDIRNVNVNDLDCEGYSPLDIAEASIPETSSLIMEALKSNGATLNVFQHKNLFLSISACVVYDTLLYRLAVGVSIDPSSLHYDDYYIDYAIAKSNVSKLSANIRKEVISIRDSKGRTPLHFAIITRPQTYTGNLTILTKVVEILIAFGCSVNETDIYRRTPLHYASDEEIISLLLSYGADPVLKDNEEMPAIEMAKMLDLRRKTNKRSESFRDHIEDIIYEAVDRIYGNPLNYKEDEDIDMHCLEDGGLNRWCEHLNPVIIPEIVWKVGEYAFLHPSVIDITREVTDFIKNLAFEIERRDPRFETTVRLVGSSYEGTKLDLPDEFDFNLIFTKISRLCEVSLSPELPNGFVHLKRTQSRNNDVKEFDDLFNNDEILITEKLNEQFNILCTNVLRDTNFIETHKNFDWDCDLKLDEFANFDRKNVGLATTFELSKTKMEIGNEKSITSISIDIVPCIHIDGWWPDEAIPSVVYDDIKTFGCNFVLDWPQRLYPWVPYSESCARISFAPAESEMIRRSSDVAKQAFMVGKQLITKSNSSEFRWEKPSCYTLKNSFLYCIEALTDTPFETVFESGLNSDTFKSYSNQINFKRWLESLMNCHLYFVAQDFCPCYFMPTFCLPINEGYRVDDHASRATADNDFQSFTVNLDAYLLYRCISLDVSKISFLHLYDFCHRRSSLDCILEHFDREQMIRHLRESASQSQDINRQKFSNCHSYCHGKVCKFLQSIIMDDYTS